MSCGQIHQISVYFLEDLELVKSCRVTSASVCIQWKNREDYYESIVSEHIQVHKNNSNDVQRATIGGINQHTRCFLKLGK